MATDVNDLLVEIGTEELPPKALRTLSESFAAELAAELDAAGLAHGTPAPYATPRRLAVLVPGVPGTQPDRDVERRGPPLARAFDGNDEPTKAALGFARSVGVEVDRLVRIETGDGAWLGYRFTKAGAPIASLLPGMVERTLARLPVPRRMRWGDRDTEFVRPVHWVVLMHGSEVIEAEILGIASGRATRGHRFHHPGDIVLRNAGEYATALRREGHVVARFEERMDIIHEQVERAADELDGRARIDPALLEENAALVEWPIAVAGHFDTEFLDLPDAALIATMQGHQRYFPVADGGGALMPHFVAVSNIESRNTETVRAGNERVIRPRLSDAAYFFDTDRGRRLETRLEELGDIVFQRKLGSLRAKSHRVAVLAGRVARAMGGTGEAVAHAERAGLLAKCDLVTEMVGEFPELQGEMGREYARLDGEPAAVADAIGELYMPRFADDGIPDTAAGRAVAIADKLDTIAGCVSLGQIPTGDRDPFALRRAALGTLRIMIEGDLDLDLGEMIEAAFECYAEPAREASDGAREGAPDDMATPVVTASPDTAAEVRRFMVDRLRAYFADRSIPTDVFNAVLAKEPAKPLDFAMRVRAVEAFRALPEAASLAAANKRIRNILRQAKQGGIDIPDKADDSSFRSDPERALSGMPDAEDEIVHVRKPPEDAERSLAAMLDGIEPPVREMLDAGEYTGALASLAGLRDDVDHFFDTVKVMDDDETLRGNRLALLARIGALFMETADISLLQPAS